MRENRQGPITSYDPELEEGTDVDIEVVSKYCKSKLSWDGYFMGIADAVALRSSCCRRQVAAIIVKDNRIISTGYNGTPRGAKNCDEGGCPRCNAPKSVIASGAALEDCLCSHGEENAIVQAAYHGVAIEGSTLYTTMSPCLMCAKMIVNSGIVEIVFSQTYNRNDVALRLLLDCKIKLRRHPDGFIWK